MLSQMLIALPTLTFTFERRPSGMKHAELANVAIEDITIDAPGTPNPKIRRAICNTMLQAIT